MSSADTPAFGLRRKTAKDSSSPFMQTKSFSSPIVRRNASSEYDSLLAASASASASDADERDPLLLRTHTMARLKAPASAARETDPPSRPLKRADSMAALDERAAAIAVDAAATKNPLYRSHSITALAVLVGFLLYGAFYSETGLEDELRSGTIVRGIGMACLSFVLIGALMFKNGPFIRPHPVFWRAVLAMSVVYLLASIFLLFQPLHTARQLMALIDPALGRPLPEKSYCEDCALTLANVREGLDFFVIAHVLGWWAKTIILRDRWLCWILSVSFEFCEYSLQHQLPNFAECWWDHWVLDVLTCNWLGIWLGMRTVEWLEMKSYAWRDIGDIPTVSGKVLRTVEQFTPHAWISFDWAATRSLKGYVVVTVLCALLLASEVLGFYLKFLLWIPPPHPLYVLRSVLYAFAGCAGLRELYQYCTDPDCVSMGSQVWVLVATVLTEALVVAKWSQGQFPVPHPRWVLRFWTASAVSVLVFPMWHFYIRPRLLPSKGGL